MTPSSSVSAASAITDFTFTPSSSTTSTNSFAQQLASALEGFLSQAANGSGMAIDITPQQSQNSGTSQFVVTVQNLGSAGGSTSQAGSATAASSTASSGSTASVMVGTSAASSASAATAASSAANTAAADTGSMGGMVASAASLAASEALHGWSPSAVAAPAAAPLPTATQAYWAAQPAAVQALQDMPYEQRPAAAMALAEQGYTIDYPIMVLGWDPMMVMNLRQEDGYTWVPSAMQPQVPVPPGFTFPGLPSYDAANPPAGSIQVSTAFANGTSGDAVFNFVKQAEAVDLASS